MYDSLSRIDLNLLLALQVLLEEKNTARAAERLFISQSAMSKTLSRLRTTFGDELFTRHPHGLKPTPKAEALAEPLSQALQNVFDIVNPAEFDPADTTGEITIGIAECVAVFFMPRLIARLKALAPKVIIKSHNVIDDYRELLHNGTLDFVVYQGEQEDNLESSLIGNFEFVCLMRADHPLAGQDEIDDEAFFSNDHILYTTPKNLTAEINKFVDATQHFADNQYCITETSQLLLAFEIILNSDSLLITPSGTHNLTLCGDRFVEKSIKPMSLHKAPRELYLTRHKRSQHLPLHNWVADHITEEVSRRFPIEH